MCHLILCVRSAQKKRKQFANNEIYSVRNKRKRGIRLKWRHHWKLCQKLKSYKYQPFTCVRLPSILLNLSFKCLDISLGRKDTVTKRTLKIHCTFAGKNRKRFLLHPLPFNMSIKCINLPCVSFSVSLLLPSSVLSLFVRMP